jgi:hypothetical protein
MGCVRPAAAKSGRFSGAATRRRRLHRAGSMASKTRTGDPSGLLVGAGEIIEES